MNHTASRTLALSFIAAAGLAITACGGGGGDDGPTATQAVSIDFDVVAGTTPVRCGTAVSALGTTSASAQPQDLRFYVSAVKLIKSDGTEVAVTLGANDDWNYTAGNDSVTLIDLEDATGSCATATNSAGTNSKVTGTVPVGTYTGVRFDVGVPRAINHTDYATAPAPLDSAAMAWSWQSGRKFAKIEVTDPAGTGGTWTAKTFTFHLGATGCTGNPVNGETVSCVAPNRAAVKLASFDPTTQKIALDIADLLKGENVTANGAGASGCMSGGADPECDSTFAALDINFVLGGGGSGLPQSDGVNQTAFKALAR